MCIPRSFSNFKFISMLSLSNFIIKLSKYEKANNQNVLPEKLEVKVS